MAKDNEESKGSKVLSEIKAFFTLVFIIGLISVGGWYWYTHFYTPNKNVEKEEEKEQVVAGEYQVKSYKAENGHSIDVLNDKFIYEFDDDSFDLFKVMDIDGNVLFEGKEKYSYFYEGIDGKFYLVKEETADNENVISLYKFNDKKAELVKKIVQPNIYFVPVLKDDVKDGKELLIGYYGVKVSMDDGESSLEKAYYYNLEGKEYTSEEFYFDSDKARLSVGDPCYTNNEKFMKIQKKDNKGKYGLLDLEKFEIVIEPFYDELFTNYDGKTLIAVKDDKAGIIDENQKKIVDFEYDFIDRNKGFYVVSKDNKLAIMDENFKLVSDFEFDYQDGGLSDMEYSYTLCCTNFNTFSAYKVGDKYILVTNAYEIIRNLNYKKSITYVIKNDGSFDSITANDFVVTDDLIYSYSKAKKEYTVYDKSLTPKYSVDASKYDFGSVLNLERDGNTLAFEGKKVYFDYETGEEIDEPRDYEYSFENVRVQYGHGKVNMLVDDKNVYSYEYKPFGESKYLNNIENGVYYLTENEAVVLKK